MKKAFLLLIVVAAVTSILWFKVSAASAPSIKTIVYAEFFTDVAAGKKVPARMMADTHFQNLDCAATERPGYVLCQFPDQYAGQQLDIEFTKNKIMFVYTVDVPKNQ